MQNTPNILNHSRECGNPANYELQVLDYSCHIETRCMRRNESLNMFKELLHSHESGNLLRGEGIDLDSCLRRNDFDLYTYLKNQSIPANGGIQ
jgi:hypothetical protein